MTSRNPAAGSSAAAATDGRFAGKTDNLADSAEVAVSASGVSKRFKVKETGATVLALDNVDVQVATGQLTAIVGPDGAGKTTFLRLVSGLMRPDTGSLQVLGIDVIRNPQAVQDRISYMPQKFGLYEDLSVQENLDLYADLHGVAQDVRRERFANLLEMTDLKRFTARLAGKLSGGMKQKLGLACTLVRSPQLLLLDEPTVGVDPLSRRELWEIVQQLREQEQLSVLLTTAYLDEAERCASVYVLHEGRLLSSGPPEATSEHARGLCYLVTPTSNEHPRDLQAQLLDNTAAVIDAVPEAGDVRVIRRPESDPSQLQLNGRALEPAQARLEDGFMVLLRSGSDLDMDATTDQITRSRNNAAPGFADSRSATQTQQTSRESAADAIDQPHLHEAPHTASGNGNNGIVIDVRDLVRKFGEFTAVDSTTFNVKRGEIFGLLGPNGAGKTTTFRMLCGLLPATSGHAEVAGMDMRKARAEARQRIGYVSQKFALYGNLSVMENLRFFGRAYGLMSKRLAHRITAVTTQFELQRYEKMPAGQLPGGVKQRLAMAVGLLHEPDVLFLDEPTSGTDPLARRGFWQRITRLAGGGTTIVITTHFMEEAEYCDRIVIQDAGKLVAYGTPDEVRTQAGGTDRMTMEAAFIRIVEQGRSERGNSQKVAA
ncbi:ABC-2 type transport system ATP-binding protein [Advenella incenata]|jgi:ABC-2 type transport system ATP-binding protein|uniref:ABC-2 type transport system ATP-binding protein n=1 Tax=Advenella incenata TaxID=267800 RepID=A0A4Q7VAV4_9BURK|nr:ATP-binding cassette domain-containing protein [Advenella incenata]RZT93926.1 ABC-2 type transport system ATP-binding protein [Advenella incenata]